MTNGLGAQLPNHVEKYLERHEVAPSDLTPEALETFAALSVERGRPSEARREELERRLRTEVVLKIH